MKKLFPIAIIAIFGAVLYSSCTKHRSQNEYHYCDCSYPSKVNGEDSVVVMTTFGYNYSANAAKTQCGIYQNTIAPQYPSVTCKLEQ